MAESANRSVQLTGPLSAVAFPGICVRCGSASCVFVRHEKVFLRQSDDSSETICVAVAIPACDSCARQHRMEHPPIPAGRRLLLMFRSRHVYEALGPLLVAGFLAYLGMKFLLRGELVGLAIVGVIGAVFGAMGLYLARLAWDDSHQFTVRPPSSLTACFDFTDDQREIFEPEHRRFTMTNPAFAAAFIELNSKRMWHPDGRRAQVAGRKRDLLVKAVLVIGGAVVLWSVLDDLGLLPFK